MKKILIKLIAIFFLLRILGGYAQYVQATPALSFPSSTETSQMDSAEGHSVDIPPADFVEGSNNP